MNRRARLRGFSLPELMVSLTIGLVLVLAVSMMIARQEDIRRGISSSNELSNNVAYSAFVLDRELRNAGAGLVRAINWGCTLAASRNNAQLLPSLQAFPAPFGNIAPNYVVAPLIVYAGTGVNGSDQLVLSAGNSGLSETGQAVAPQSATPGQVQLSNTLGMRDGDLVLLSQGQAGNCLLEQVSPGFVGGPAPTLTFGGDYAANTVAGVALTDFGLVNTAFVSVLGNVNGNRPRFQLIGINATNQLVTYDLLQLAGNTPQPLVEGVVALKVLYGIDSTGQRLAVNSWVSPAAAGFTAAALTSSAGLPNLSNILAVRVGLVVRSDQVSKDAVTAGTLTLFSSGLTPGAPSYTYTVPPGTTNQHYRAVEFTVPLKNARF